MLRPFMTLLLRGYRSLDESAGARRDSPPHASPSCFSPHRTTARSPPSRSHPMGRAASSGRVFRSMAVTPSDRVTETDSQHSAPATGPRPTVYPSTALARRIEDRPRPLMPHRSAWLPAAGGRIVATRGLRWSRTPPRPRASGPRVPEAEWLSKVFRSRRRACRIRMGSRGHGMLRGARRTAGSARRTRTCRWSRRSSRGRRPGAWRECASTSRSGRPRVDHQARPRDVPRDRRPASVGREPVSGHHLGQRLGGDLVDRATRYQEHSMLVGVGADQKVDTGAAPASIRSIGRAGRMYPSITGCQGIKLTATS